MNRHGIAMSAKMIRVYFKTASSYSILHAGRQ